MTGPDLREGQATDPPPAARSQRLMALKERFAASYVGHVWGRLSAADFVGEARILASLFMMCLIPFLILVASVKNVDFVAEISRELGLSKAASQDVRDLFGPSSGTLATVTVASVLWLVFIASGVPVAVQRYYMRVFEVEPEDAKGLWRMPVWVLAAAATSSLVITINGALSGEDVLVLVVDAGLNGAFWWWSMHFLLKGQRTWRYLLPAALATTLFWLCLRAFSTIFFSERILANHNKYGSIGVVLVLMSWTVSIGVVILSGAVAGAVWREHASSSSSGSEH